MPEGMRGPDFGADSEHHPLCAEQTLSDVAHRVAHEILRNAEDPLSQEIAAKILTKLEIKDRVDSMIAHADDVDIYEEYKKLGIFVVRDAEATFDYEDKDTGLSLRKGDRYLDLHLPPVPEHLRSREALNNSLDLVRQYIAAHNLQPKYLMGITYERLARLAERQFGFNVAYPSPNSLPESVVHGVERVYQGFTQAGLDGRDMGLPAIVFREISSITDTEPDMPEHRARRLAEFVLGNPNVA